MNLDDMRKANEDRDASTYSMFEQVMFLMLEAEREGNNESRNKKMDCLLECYKNALASNSNMLLKLLELETLQPPKPAVICATCAGKLDDGK